MKIPLLALFGALILSATNATDASAQANVTFTGTIDLNDPTQDGRLARDGNPSNAGQPPKAFPGNFDQGTPYHFDLYSVTNTTGATTAFSVVLTLQDDSLALPFSVAYLGSFDPTNIATNYLGDVGSSPQNSGESTAFSVLVPAGATLDLVVNEVSPDFGVAAYTLAVNAVPEPSTWSLMGLGTLGLGAAALRRRRHAA